MSQQRRRGGIMGELINGCFVGWELIEAENWVTDCEHTNEIQ